MRKALRNCCVLVVWALLALPACVWAQAPAAQPPQSQPAAADKKAPAAAGSGAEQSQGSSEEGKISPAEAEELFRSVDEILQFASKDSGLPIKQEVKRRLTSRDEFVAYVNKHLAEDEDAQRLRRSELVLKKFGLLPANFDLQSFLVTLLREQVAGYYDPKTQMVNLLDWLGPEQQRPVLAHELTHALQDQSFGLEKWLKAGDDDLDHKPEPTPADIENDEVSEAHQAVVEGQAMVTLIDYMLAPVGKSLADSPEVAKALKDGMLVGTADSAAFGNAPLYLKEALVFPYRYGIDFEAELLKSGGKARAFAGAFANPPQSTRQIMEPKTYLAGERLQAMKLPDFDRDFKNYERFDIGSMGEFDTAVLIDQYAGAEQSRNLYPEWRGGYYYAARMKGDANGPLGLLYVSRWSSSQKASAFAAIYARSLQKRYQRAREIPLAGERAAGNLDLLETLAGHHAWLTEAGAVVIAQKGDEVLVTESLDQPLSEKLEHDLLPDAKESPAVAH